jgi:long-subunit acyl-CoA synthetase (AMP-forming)
MEKKALIQYFYEREKTSPDNPFLNQPFGDNWEMYTWGQVGQMARKVANYILQQGLPKGSKIGLVSKNCREWVITDLAIMMAEMVSVPFFATLSGEQIAEVLDIGDVEMLFVGKTEVWGSMKTGIPSDMPVVRFPHYEDCDKVDIGTDWTTIMESTSPLEGTPAASMDELWTIIFTSGTTGTPKGVMHDYNNVQEVITFVKEVNPMRSVLDGTMRLFSYLPLNHIAERVLLVTCIAFGGQIFYTESLERFGQNLHSAQPTTFFAVPRIWTKFMQGILSKMPQAALDAVLADPVKAPVVKKQIATQLGLQNSSSNISGAAPIAQTTKDWWAKLGLPIGEAFGMTENFAVCSFLKDDVAKPGSVGKPHIGTELKIDEASGEILTKAPWTMKGYYKSPEKTAETIVDGWLHTGDKGKLDEEGYLYIIGRVKDTFKTAKGEFIVPSKVEDKFSENNDIEAMCLLGLGMPQPVLLVAPSEIGLNKSAEELKESLQNTLTKANEQLDNYTKVTTCVICNDALSVEKGTLTPTLKVKRNKVHELYKDRLPEFCDCEESVIWDS